MRLDIGAALGDALALWRGNRDLLLRVAGLFFFLPLFATGLLRPAPPEALRSGAETGAAQSSALLAYYIDIAPYVIVGSLIATFGAAIFYLLFQHERPPVGAAMKRVAALFVPLVLALLVMELLVIGGTILFILPGLYAMGRTFLVGVVVIAEGKTNPIEAVARGIALTQKLGWLLFFVSAVIFLIGLVGTSIVGSVHDLLAMGSDSNPVAEIIFAALTAAIGTVMAMAEALVKIAIYRRLT